MSKVVGQFIYDEATNTLEGPAEYMREQGDAKASRMLAGTDPGFNAILAGAPAGSDIITVFLVGLQTDYAGWKGAREFCTRAGVRQ